MIAFGFVAHAQLEEYKNAKTPKSFTLNKMEVNFTELGELVQFKEKIANGKSGLEKLNIDSNFIFTYNIKEKVTLKKKNLVFNDMKVEIKDQPNRAALIKEINDSIDGLITIAAVKY